MEHYFYIVQFEKAKIIKIGVTKNLTRRMRMLEEKFDEPVIIFYCKKMSCTNASNREDLTRVLLRNNPSFFWWSTDCFKYKDKLPQFEIMIENYSIEKIEEVVAIEFYNLLDLKRITKDKGYKYFNFNRKND